MQLNNYSQNLESPNSENFIYRDIEIAILSSLTVDDCVVIEKQTKNLESELVAYIVPSGLFVPEQLLSHLQAILPRELVPTAIVTISTIPLTSTGQVDEVTLASLEVIDSDLIYRAQKQLESLSAIERVAVVAEPLVTNVPPVHLQDLLGETEAIAFEDSQQNLQATIPRQNVENQETFSSKNLAISQGEPLPQSENAPKTLKELLQKATQNSTKNIIYIQPDGSEKFQSYREVWQDAQRILSGLRKLGLKPQDKVIFQLEDNQDFICGFWACVLGGFVPVPISIAPTYELANSIASKLQNTWQMLDKPFVLTNAALAPKIDDLSKFLKLENFQFAIIDQLRECEPDLNLYQSQPEDLAILFLTSGSTGIPKCVMLNHHNLLSMTTGLILMGHFSSQESVLNWMPLDHVGALVSLSIMAVSLGCQQIHVPTNLIVQNPLLWLDLIDKHQATISWAPNFAFSLICDALGDSIYGKMGEQYRPENNQKHWDLSSMGFVINAGEPIVTKIARNFLKLLRPYGLPTNAIHPAFGMSETSSGITYSDSFSLESSSDDSLFVELGLPLAGASLRIVDENEQIVTESTIGRLQVQGASVTSGYYQNPQANQEIFTFDGWFNTGDLGFLHQGRLTITGRQKDVIIINGLNYYCHEIEAAVEEIKEVEVSYTAACAVRQPGIHTDKLAIFFHTAIVDDTSLLTLLKEIRTSVVNKVGINPDYLLPVEPEAIPKTAIGKIQRSQLSRRFNTGEFKSVIKHVDILLGNANTIPDWFYRQVWQPKNPITFNSSLNLTNCTLVFLDAFGLGTYLCQILSERNLQYITVSPGEDFRKINHSHYTITPGQAKDYKLLLKSLATDNITIGQILHLWNYDQYLGEITSIEALEAAQEKGIYSLLFLVQALAKVQGVDSPIQLLFISSYVQSISSDDPIAYEKSPVLGLLKTIPQELPCLNCRHIDLPFAEVEKTGTYLLQEMQVSSKEREVAYRNGQRFIPRLEKVDFTSKPKSPISFKHRGTYLITGGLGGIGIEIARYLLKHYQARLLLVGRTPLIHHGKEDVITQHQKAYQELSQLGGEVIYEAVDICDLNHLQIIVEKAQSQWCKNLDGVLHLAGTSHEQMILEETQENLAAILRPKVFGAWTLHQLVKDNKGSIFINFSSVNGFFGSTAVGAYAAANSFLDGFSHYQNSHSELTSYCLSWSMWHEIGMSQGYQLKNLIRTKGFYVMSSSQAISSMLATLQHQQTHLLIGLDGSNQNIQLWQSQAFNLQKLSAYFTTHSSDDIFKLQHLTVEDRFGNSCNCNLVKLKEIPLTESGAIDKNKLIRQFTGQDTGTHVAPRNKLEQQIADIWEQVLGRPVFSVHHNFFELGGNSLVGTQVISRLRNTFSIDLSLQSLFKLPTVAELASNIEVIEILMKNEYAIANDIAEEYEEGCL
ncbi:AMP-dependent synthetase and ligase [Trichormus variabilis ATCC 29413]|uniref:AMP-dependent synthetase and ligase n=2 Tax=Anabaena variabilis TaxID=264691 RepID=Q3MCQ4_TRIV2|nr:MULTISPECIES: SDR family NAD(P)-dependent oxidoreductase [Nostocaceae]ABA21232.1 AMP-dependent synthetase and ligase [Trichormus variabilis ATCC 29413]MBC1216530.1 SDR family NAD(P)-dependent oxidoreductase [Trichormus variabilis ARAD]MBC1256075.1 SDR family NAD(P)-dependent oxidoreductase [Trichormus variabilis V5]MBC1269080.1 SDR family NAD(P)-dependent oxidoreductase [Trichormus variabilis FSR]MBC1304828.1 SDR family NAD(P)-dependent oxidoreductase [Trichormus variabilis N2B]